MTPTLSAVRLLAVLWLALPLAACGKKGPPLPPLVRIPAAPEALEAARRGEAVDVRFKVPASNTDGSRPANIQRVELFALNGTAPASAAEVLKSGVRVGSVDVKAPRDPNTTVDADEPDSDLDPLEGPGLDQGAATALREVLTPTVAPSGATRRTYVGVGITTRGRRGTLSEPVAVTLGEAPPAPGAPSLAYDETAITVSWPPLAGPAAEDAAAPGYHVYDLSPPANGVEPVDARRLTDAPLDQPRFQDTRVAWNEERCYAVRAVRTIEGLAVEGDASPTRCTTLKDTFAPAAPTGVTTVASAGTINLIWTPNAEQDLAGYVVLRAEQPSGDLRPVTPAPISESTFSDTVQAGVRYVYAVQAVDSAGNASALSERVEETAR
ncbi:MAG: fibronectin type III domain-containing protein [Vicinamibacterales bacterium]